MIKEKALNAARRAKHQVWTLRKVSAQQARELLDTTAQRLRPLNFNPHRYPLHRFLRFDAPMQETLPAPERIFVLWTGLNEMPAIRAANLGRIRTIVGVPVEFVTPATLHEWTVEHHPLHPAYPHLSLTHRSDYLRAYLLHHHGGGYMDLKAPAGSWADMFTRLNGDSEAWVLGYPEDSRGRIPPYGGHMERDLRIHFASVMGTMAMIARPRSPFTAEWFHEVERRLDYFLPLLRDHPGGVRDEIDLYPVGWTQILADIAYPLSLKHHDHIRLEKGFTPPDEDYR